MNTDGSDQENITDHPEGDFLADWSPDGSQIAFDTNRSIGTAIFIMDRDGGNVRPLVNVPSHNVLPSWSPDGNRIVFDSTRDGNREIYIINVNGSGLTPDYEQLSKRLVGEVVPRRRARRLQHGQGRERRDIRNGR